MTATERTTILIVDDEREVAEAYAEQLSERYEVEAAYSGEDALQALTAEIDVVLLDRRMPGVSGQDVLTRIRERNLTTRVAMVTAVDPDFDIIDMPFDDYVIKPATKADLFETVERLLTCTAYESHIRKYYSLTSKYAALQASKTNAELETSEEFQALEAELERNREALEQIVDSFDNADYEVVLRDFGGDDRDQDRDRVQFDAE